MAEIPSSDERLRIPAPPAPRLGAGTARPASGGLLTDAVGAVWRFFSSVRVAVWMISFLTLLTLIGTLKGSVVPERLADAVPATQGFVDGWYRLDVFGSWWYSATLGVIAVSIVIGGMLNRIPGIWRTIVRPTVTTTRSFLLGTSPNATVQIDRTPDELVAALTESMRRRRYRVVTRRIGEDIHLYADRNRWGKLGTFPFHIALVMVVIGGIVVTQFGFRDIQFVVAQGETVPIGRGTDLSVRLDRFVDDYYEDGTAARYQSNITLFRGDDEVRRGAVEPNSPVEEGSVSIYQSGFGYTVDLRITDRAGAVVFDGPVTLGIYQSSANPDAPAGMLTVPGTGVTLNLIAADRDAANLPELDTLRLAAGQLFIQARTAGAAPGVTPPSVVVDPSMPGQLGDLTVDFERFGVYSVMQVAYYPGLWLFGVAAVIGIAGLVMIFYFPLRRVRAIVSPRPTGGATALLAPLARRDWSGKRDFVELVEGLDGGAVRLNDAPERA